MSTKQSSKQSRAVDTPQGVPASMIVRVQGFSWSTSRTLGHEGIGYAIFVSGVANSISIKILKSRPNHEKSYSTVCLPLSHPSIYGSAMSSGVNTSELIAKIQQLAGLSDDERSRLIGLLRSHKKYGVVWEDKPEDVEERLRDELPILREVKERFVDGWECADIPSDGECANNNSTPNHILIEGDNLEALTALSYTHEGKIDVIYIDPPYNTGNKDFVYNDSFVDSEDSYRHSKWLSFMNKRLKIAKRLLSDKGVIFISIDDNEQAQLKLLCDEVFGSQNFVSNLIWKSKSGGANDASAFGVDHEYVLCYSKKKDLLILNNDKQATVTTSYNKIDSDGKRYALDRLDKQSLGYQQSLDFPIIGPDGREYIVEHKDPNNKKARWRWGKETVKERYDELVFIYPYVYTKNYEKENGQKPRSILFEERFG